MRKQLCFISLILLSIVGCKHKTEFKEVQIPGKFTIQVPEYLRATNDLSGAAKPSMQYENDSLKVYLLVFDTARQNLTESNLDAYYDSIAPREGENGAKLAAPMHTTVGGDSAIITEMEASINGTPTYHLFGTIATSARFYYVMMWCTKQKRDSFKEDFKKVINSFSDINHKKV